MITLSPGLRVATNTCSIYATYFQYFTGEEILHHALRHKSSGLGHWRGQAADVAAAQLDLAGAAISGPNDGRLRIHRAHQTQWLLLEEGQERRSGLKWLGNNLRRILEAIQAATNALSAFLPAS